MRVDPSCAEDWTETGALVHYFGADWGNFCDGKHEGWATSMLEFVTCAACLEAKRDAEMATEWS